MAVDGARRSYRHLSMISLFFSFSFAISFGNSNKSKIRPISTWPTCRPILPNRTYTTCCTSTGLSFRRESCAMAAVRVGVSDSPGWNLERNATKSSAYLMANICPARRSRYWSNSLMVATKTSANTRRTTIAGVTRPTDRVVSCRPTTAPSIPTGCRPFSHTCNSDVISHTKCRLSPSGQMAPRGSDSTLSSHPCTSRFDSFFVHLYFLHSNPNFDLLQMEMLTSGMDPSLQYIPQLTTHLSSLHVGSPGNPYGMGPSGHGHGHHHQHHHHHHHNAYQATALYTASQSAGAVMPAALSLAAESDPSASAAASPDEPFSYGTHTLNLLIYFAQLLKSKHFMSRSYVKCRNRENDLEMIPKEKTNVWQQLSLSSGSALTVIGNVWKLWGIARQQPARYIRENDKNGWSEGYIPDPIVSFFLFKFETLAFLLMPLFFCVSISLVFVLVRHSNVLLFCPLLFLSTFRKARACRPSLDSFV